MAAAASGYSGTPLRKKLGITDASAVAIVGPAPALPDVEANSEFRVGLDVLLAFVTEQAEFAAGLVEWSNAIQADGAIWVCWPKKSARKTVPSDMTEDVVRDVALPTGLVDNKVCAIDEVWSGLRLVWRLEHRPARRAARKHGFG